MDLLLSHGFFLREDPSERKVMKPHPPLGILYLSSYLKSRGFDVQVFDSTFSDREAFRNLLEREKPPVVGLYANLTTRATVLDMIRTCREQGALVVCGGPEPAAYADQYLAHGAHAVVVGEGEETLEELLGHLARTGPESMEHIRGLAYLRDGRTHTTEPRPFIADLDRLPLPDREAIDIFEYIEVWRERHGKGSVSLITSRGCPYTCAWCSHGVFGYSYRSRSPGHVADEVQAILETYRPDMLWYADDVFTMNRRWFFEFARELKERKLRIPFETISREDRLDEEVIRELAEIRCSRLWIGSESGSQSVLDGMQRRTDAVRVREMVRLLQRHGIEAGLFVMLGYEGERQTDLQATLDLLIEADPDVYLSTVAYPIKGTPYFDQVADRIVSPKSWEEGSDRELRIAGRHSRRYYDFANRWIAGEVALKKAKASASADLLGKLKATVNARVGRLGMRLTRREVEGAR